MKPTPSDLKTAARLKEAQEFLGKTDAEMDEIMRPKMHPWSHYTKTGIASAMMLGRACRLTGWTMAYILGETDDKNHDPVAVRGIACKRGQPPKIIREMKPNG